MRTHKNAEHMTEHLREQREAEAARWAAQTRAELKTAHKDGLRWYKRTYRPDNVREVIQVPVSDLTDNRRAAAQPDTLLLIPFTGYSDYSGSALEESNFRALMDRWNNWRARENGDQVLLTVYGGHGYRQIAANLDAASDEFLGVLQEELEWFERGDLIVDPEDYADLRSEHEQAAMNDYILEDFRRELVEIDSALAALDPEADKIRELFWTAFRLEDGTFNHETGGGVYTHPSLDRLAAAVAANPPVAYYELFPTDFQWDFPQTPIHPGQRHLSLTMLYGFSVWAPWVGRA